MFNTNVKISVFIKPNSKKGPLVEPQPDGSLIVFVREPAVDGKANAAALELLANYYSVSKSRVSLAKGASARYKVFIIDK